MKLAAIIKRTSWSTFSVFEFVQHHGEALNDGPADQQRIPGIPSLSPLRIIRAGNVVPSVFAASTNLVVREDVLRLISGRKISAIRVVFEKLVYIVPDNLQLQKRMSRDPLSAITRLPDVRAYHSTVGTYFEILSVGAGVWAREHPEYTLRDIFVETDGERKHIELCRQMFDASEFVFTMTGTIVNRDVFDLLYPYIDWRFFGNMTFEI